VGCTETAFATDIDTMRAATGIFIAVEWAALKQRLQSKSSHMIICIDTGWTFLKLMRAYYHQQVSHAAEHRRVNVEKVDRVTLEARPGNFE
jgi:hypothetical protein